MSENQLSNQKIKMRVIYCFTAERIQNKVSLAIFTRQSMKIVNFKERN